MKKIRPPNELLWISTPDDGKKLELYATFDGMGWSLARITADDEDESLWFEIQIDDRVVQIPLSAIHEMLQAAEKGVHSESWYGRNYPESQEDGLSMATRAFMKRNTPNDT